MLEKLYALSEVEERTSRKASAIYNDIRKKRFPEPVRLAGGTIVRWRESDLQAWMDGLPRGVDAGMNADAREAGIVARRNPKAEKATA